MRFRLTLIGTTPLLMHNPRMVDPEFALNREIKAITAKRKKTDDDFAAIERLEWYGGLYEEDGVIVQPTSKVRKCLVNTARINKAGKQMERALSFSELYVPLEFDGPGTVDGVYADKRFHSRLSVGVNGKRVMRVRPRFMPWALSLSGLFVEDAGMNVDEFLGFAEMAGVVEGIGDGRAIGYGRFAAKVEKIK